MRWAILFHLTLQMKAQAERVGQVLDRQKRIKESIKQAGSKPTVKDIGQLYSELRKEGKDERTTSASEFVSWYMKSVRRR